VAARREQARSVGDVLLRRTRLGLLAAGELLTSPPGGVAEPVRRVARVLGAELDWSPERVALESESFSEEAHREGLDLA
jgi:glycerol-3-phosphate dehydrogenase